MAKADPKIVTIGGGTGSFNILLGLKQHSSQITAIVSMADDGGSTGLLRDELGVLPPGDVRQCLVALSRSSRVMRELFTYRFPKGSLKGHAFGNLFLTALEKTTGSFNQAIAAASQVLNITGKVVPVTLESTSLALRYHSGEVVKHEAVIDHMKFKNGERPAMFLEPPAKLNPAAAKAIADADLVVIAPGSLHTSLIPNLLVKGMPRALARTKATVVYVCNLVTTPGQTDGYEVDDFAAELEHYGGKGLLDLVVVNKTEPPADLIKRYAAEKEYWVKFDATKLKGASYRAIGANLFSRAALRESLIRHDGDKVAKLLIKQVG